MEMILPTTLTMFLFMGNILTLRLMERFSVIMLSLELVALVLLLLIVLLEFCPQRLRMILLRICIRSCLLVLNSLDVRLKGKLPSILVKLRHRLCMTMLRLDCKSLCLRFLPSRRIRLLLVNINKFGSERLDYLVLKR
ncbi:hypothetical protein [Circovirus-like genome DHCV-2]|uniref:Uncharacterized protein n=1 Tax=Circovirus-like genome DHCV-2 TaxID=1788451 RepID=A0A190WHE5_9VIRU|nr:hypothetical protein [Circovirus-like genome DHCV-2]AMB42999.1 hypothetical protein [Circovirus-like genome DHCV-2]